MAGKTEEKKLTFHVVNSVKGGSGKSTFSLLLANYYIEHCDELAYIIDLDVCGSSWKDNYKGYIKNNAIYLNNLMDDFSKYISREYTHKLLVQNENSRRESIEIPLCIYDSSDAKVLDEVEVDLFEEVIKKIILKIYEDSKPSEKNLNIILDMPPSYEIHAEKILTHLLLDINSRLYIDLVEENGKLPYNIELYMLSSLIPAHIELNYKYIQTFYKGLNYSNQLGAFRNGEKNEAKFHIIMVINDVSHIVPAEDPEGYKNVLSASSKKDQESEDIKIDAWKYLKYEYLGFYEQLMGKNIEKVKSGHLLMKGSTRTLFETFMESEIGLK